MHPGGIGHVQNNISLISSKKRKFFVFAFEIFFCYSFNARKQEENCLQKWFSANIFCFDERRDFLINKMWGSAVICMRALEWDSNL